MKCTRLLPVLVWAAFKDRKTPVLPTCSLWEAGCGCCHRQPANAWPMICMRCTWPFPEAHSLSVRTAPEAQWQLQGAQVRTQRTFWVPARGSQCGELFRDSSEVGSWEGEVFWDCYTQCPDNDYSRCLSGQTRSRTSLACC